MDSLPAGHFLLTINGEKIPEREKIVKLLDYAAGVNLAILSTDERVALVRHCIIAGCVGENDLVADSDLPLMEIKDWLRSGHQRMHIADECIIVAVALEGMARGAELSAPQLKVDFDDPVAHALAIGRQKENGMLIGLPAVQPYQPKIFGRGKPGRFSSNDRR